MFILVQIKCHKRIKNVYNEYGLLRQNVFSCGLHKKKSLVYMAHHVKVLQIALLNYLFVPRGVSLYGKANKQNHEDIPLSTDGIQRTAVTIIKSIKCSC